MGLIKLHLENLTKPEQSNAELKSTLHRFMEDMNKDVSSFFHLPEKTTWASEFDKNKAALANRIPQVDTFLHLGIGGSSLGSELLVQTLRSPKAPKFHFLDNIDPDHLWNILEQTNPEKCLVYVISKSGGTMETLSQFMFIYQWLSKHLGEEKAKNHFVFCTDPEKGDLRALAQKWNIPCFDIPTNLGGRFTALSSVGFFPATVASLNVAQLMKGAYDYYSHFNEELAQNRIPEIADLANRIVSAYQKENRNITVLMPYSQKLKTLGPWFTQLWGESLGKDGIGLSPIGAVGPTDQHSILQLLRDGPQDKVVGFVEVVGFSQVMEVKWNGPALPSFDLLSHITLNQLMDAELTATRQVLTNNKRPNFTISLPRLNEYSLGQTIFALELLTAITGYILKIDPFNQPGVEEGKKLTIERIRACKKSSLA